MSNLLDCSSGFRLSYINILMSSVSKSYRSWVTDFFEARVLSKVFDGGGLSFGIESILGLPWMEIIRKKNCLFVPGNIR